MRPTMWPQLRGPILTRSSKCELRQRGCPYGAGLPMRWISYQISVKPWHAVVNYQEYARNCRADGQQCNTCSQCNKHPQPCTVTCSLHNTKQYAYACRVMHQHQQHTQGIGIIIATLWPAPSITTAPSTTTTPSMQTTSSTSIPP